MSQISHGQELTASWYSEASLKKEGTWKTSKGIMANGRRFEDDKFTCAVRGYPLGSVLRVTRIDNNKNMAAEAGHKTNHRSVRATVTDRIGKRFAGKRLDLTPVAFSRLAKLKVGLVAVKVERIK